MFLFAQNERGISYRNPSDWESVRIIVRASGTWSHDLVAVGWHGPDGSHIKKARTCFRAPEIAAEGEFIVLRGTGTYERVGALAELELHPGETVTFYCNRELTPDGSHRGSGAISLSITKLHPYVWPYGQGLSYTISEWVFMATHASRREHALESLQNGWLQSWLEQAGNIAAIEAIRPQSTLDELVSQFCGGPDDTLVAESPEAVSTANLNLVGVEIYILFNEGKSIEEIGSRFGVAVQEVRNWLTRNGLESSERQRQLDSVRPPTYIETLWQARADDYLKEKVKRIELKTRYLEEVGQARLEAAVNELKFVELETKHKELAKKYNRNKKIQMMFNLLKLVTVIDFGMFVSYLFNLKDIKDWTEATVQSLKALKSLIDLASTLDLKVAKASIQLFQDVAPLVAKFYTACQEHGIDFLPTSEASFLERNWHKLAVIGIAGLVAHEEELDKLIRRCRSQSRSTIEVK